MRRRSLYLTINKLLNRYLKTGICVFSKMIHGIPFCFIDSHMQNIWLFCVSIHAMYCTLPMVNHGSTRNSHPKREVYPLFPNSEILKTIALDMSIILPTLTQPLFPCQFDVFTFFGITLFGNLYTCVRALYSIVGMGVLFVFVVDYRICGNDAFWKGPVRQVIQGSYYCKKNRTPIAEQTEETSPDSTGCHVHQSSASISLLFHSFFYPCFFLQVTALSMFMGEYWTQFTVFLGNGKVGILRTWSKLT